MDAQIAAESLSAGRIVLLLALGMPLIAAMAPLALAFGDAAARLIERRFALARPKPEEGKAAPILYILLAAAFMASFLTVMSMGERTFARMLLAGLSPFALAILIGWPTSLPATVLWTIAMLAPGLAFVLLAYLLIGA